MEQEGLTKKQRRQFAREQRRKEREKDFRLKRLYKFIAGFIPLVIIVFFGFKYFSNSGNTSSVERSDVLGIQSGEWVKGPQEAKVTIVEYGDFQCPACKDYQSIVNRLLGDFSNDLKVVYRHYPLAQHDKAFDAAKASEAAGMQGKFWEMHDKLYDKQEEWVNDVNYKERFVTYVKDLGLNEEKYKSDFESDEVKGRIEKDVASAKSLGISSTPSFFINGKKIVSIKSYEDFAGMVRDALNK